MNWLVYIGGFDKSIEVFNLQLHEENILKTSMTLKESIQVEDKPAFIDIQNNTMYVIHELNQYQGQEQSAVTVYKVDEHGALTNIQCRPTLGVWPCHVAFNKLRNMVYIPSYYSGHFEIATIAEDGRLNDSFYQHHFPNEAGSCVDPDGRQIQSHPHGSYLKSDHIYIPDLGADRIWHFKHGDGEDIIPCDPSFIETTPGFGPRHMVFHPTYDLVFVIGELSCELLVYRLHKQSGNLIRLAVYNYLYPHQNTVRNYGSEIDLNPTGEFLYLSNRGHGSIISFKVLDSDGHLEKVECFDTVGTWPRAFSMDPTGRLILCADQFNDVIEVLSIDQKSGRLERVCEVACKNKPSSFIFKEQI